LSESSERWRADLDSMIASIERAVSYIDGMSFDIFLDDTRTQDATVMNLVVLSEAARGIPGEIRDAHPEIPWRQITGFRNRVAHSNTTVDLSLDHTIVWSILTQDLPTLLNDLRAIVGD
jgi:uncharacterized protein with HEPN domain